jgi:hypothetical protein
MSTHFVCFAQAHGIFFHAVFRRCTHHTQGRSRVKRHGVVGTASLPHHPTRTRHVPGLVRNTRALLGVHRRRPWPQSSQYQSPRNDVSGPATALDYTLVNTRTRDSRNGGSLCMWRHRASRPLGNRRFRESNDAASQSINHDAQKSDDANDFRFQRQQARRDFPVGKANPCAPIPPRRA